MVKPRTILLIIFFLFLLSLFFALPRNFKINQWSFSLPPIFFSVGNFSFYRDLEPKLGLDLSGGSHLVFEADISGVVPQDRDAAHEGAREIVERRVNLFGVSEPLVQTSRVGESYRIIVELPGITDVTNAVSLIGQTAQLVFATFDPASDATSSATLIPTDLSGAALVRSQVQFDPQIGKPIVGLNFNNEGAKKFEEITSKNIGRPVAILLDGQIISAPIVQEKISGGQAVITGDFTIDEVKQIVTLLNSGVLPVGLSLIEQRTVGPTLSKESIDASIQAGLVGLGAVVAFMVAYYGRLGVVATIALFIYGTLTFAIFKLLPVVLTLPGIAGFLLSVGMAVDSNILIFERLKEELRRGSLGVDALETAFGRAWDSIRDANIATLVTCFILFNPLNWQFLHTSGPVRGFAATLAIGVLMSLFTGIIVTRTLLRVFRK